MRAGNQAASRQDAKAKAAASAGVKVSDESVEAPYLTNYGQFMRRDVGDIGVDMGKGEDINTMRPGGGDFGGGGASASWGDSSSSSSSYDSGSSSGDSGSSSSYD